MNTRRFSSAGPFLVLALTLLVLGPLFWYVRGHEPMGDEHLHMDQILRFARGEFSMNEFVTQIPGYHAIIAVPAALSGMTSVDGLRLFSFLLSVATVVVFYLCARAIQPRLSGAATAQFALLPILLPYFFLLYTDVTSLLLVLLALLFALRKRFTVAGVFATLAVFVRQTDIVWLGFFLFFMLAERGYLRRMWEWLRDMIDGKKTTRFTHSPWFHPMLRESAVYLIGAGLFVAFALINGGIAVGDKSAHPFPALYPGNVYLLLFLAFFLFLPLHLANTPRIAKHFWKRPWMWLLFPLLLICAMFFVSDHPNNQAEHWFFLRNRLLLFFTADLLHKFLFFIPIGLAALSLAVTKLARRSFYLLYPFAILSLVPSWLIEHRYLFIPLALFLLFRERRSAVVEWGIAALFAPVAGFFYWGVVQGWFFL